MPDGVSDWPTNTLLQWFKGRGNTFSHTHKRSGLVVNVYIAKANVCTLASKQDFNVDFDFDF